MKTFLCFQIDNKSHLCQGNCRNMDSNSKVLWITSIAFITKTSYLCQENSRNINWNRKVRWITSPFSRTKRKVIYVKEIAETWIEIARCYENLPLLPNDNKSHLCQGNRQKMDWNSKGFWITSVVPITTKKRYLYQENSRNMDENSKLLWRTSPASRTKTKVTYVKKIAET